ncbi:Thoeris anti-defense Tad2 family protein [Xenorhabdus sp. KK7.4]|uniref:Thoeris anti-defense Tad2 family protein n=1 Tax=Xenorhabdus sp. KK7.4 TaxID=1851572 RepID=UPI000C04A7FF|nr:MW1434 family type I TA system toxin [Xenorhabdus sp. KK7.4]PHM52503.1 hypothetical protein Xekk_03180 [Xenorhabdus sp. KK7.4]
MSDVNKLDNKQCPFDPDQYKYNEKIDVEVDNVAPVGSLPWALIQVYVGKLVRRNGWDAQVEYIKLLQGSTDNNVLPQIGIVDKEGTTSWQPTQEDMMACDWILLDYTLSFNLISGSGTYNNPSLPNEPVAWGYIMNPDWGHHFGTLNIKKNNADIAKIWAFLWNQGILYFDITTKPDKENCQKVENLFQNKSLVITVDGLAYNLGKPLPRRNNSVLYSFEFRYQNSEAQKLGTLLQQMQQVGQIKTFNCDWE